MRAGHTRIWTLPATPSFTTRHGTQSTGMSTAAGTAGTCGRSDTEARDRGTGSRIRILPPPDAIPDRMDVSYGQ